ncbi:hypothetical protein [Streptomyces nigrescens]
MPETLEWRPESRERPAEAPDLPPDDRRTEAEPRRPGGDAGGGGGAGAVLGALACPLPCFYAFRLYTG